MALVDEVLAGNQRGLARLATHVENDDAVGRAGLEALYGQGGKAHVVGVTGPPGAGKSTLIGALIGEFRRRDKSVGVIAIDPSSAITGGATLGDRIRMLEWHADTGVFIRSMASRGRPGGLAPATAGMVHLLDAAGFDMIIVETVGVGQEAVDVSRLVHTLVLLQVPASGDGVQLLKAGLLEFADVFVVNKADLSGAEELMRGLRSLVGVSHGKHHDWLPVVVRCSSVSADGIAKLAEALDNHWGFLLDGDRLLQRRRTMARQEIADRVNAAILRRLRNEGIRSARIEALVEEVAARRLAPFNAADQLLASWDETDDVGDEGV